MKIKIITHYHKRDLECFSDFASIDIYVDGKHVIEFGDGYHDSGQDKVAGILDFLKAIGQEFELERESVADYE